MVINRRTFLVASGAGATAAVAACTTRGSAAPAASVSTPATTAPATTTTGPTPIDYPAWPAGSADGCSAVADVPGHDAVLRRLRERVDGDVPGAHDGAQAYYGANLPRLRTVAARYDPDRVFTFAQAINRT